MFNDDWNIDHRRWSYKLSYLGGPTLKKKHRGIGMSAISKKSIDTVKTLIYFISAAFTRQRWIFKRKNFSQRNRNICRNYFSFGLSVMGSTFFGEMMITKERSKSEGLPVQILIKTKNLSNYKLNGSLRFKLLTCLSSMKS